MFFLEIPIPEKTDLGESLLSYFQKNKVPIDKNELSSLVRSHSVYFQNKPVGFLPFKVFKKGKAQVYLKQEGWIPEVIYEDKWLIVVNKPSGLPSQSSLKPLQDHAYSSVICMLREKKPFTSPQLFLMHRLDTDTSGVLLMTKKSSANKGVQELFERKKIIKTYWALAETKSGRELPEKVISYLARKPDAKHKFKFGSFEKGHPGAKHSETHFKKLRGNKTYSLYEVSPKTGRSHQIRVHMSENHHPILGDPFYKGSEASHLFLHAKSLSFAHPMTNEPVHVEAPLPPHWVDFMSQNGL